MYRWRHSLATAIQTHSYTSTQLETPMSKLSKKQATIAIVLSLSILAALVLHHRNAIRRGEELEMTIAKMRSGILTIEAIAILGEFPQKVIKASGVLTSSITMIAAENPDIAKHGVPEEYTMCTWRRGDMNAVVAIDDSGRVAGRWTWH